MTVDLILKILSIVYALCMTISFVVTLIKSKTKNKKVQQDCDNTLTFIFKIEEVIAFAEKFLNWTGAEKKAYVYSMLYNEAKEYGISEEQLDKLIEQAVYFTNQVNIKKKEITQNGTTDTATKTDTE